MKDARNIVRIGSVVALVVAASIVTDANSGSKLPTTKRVDSPVAFRQCGPRTLAAQLDRTSLRQHLAEQTSANPEAWRRGIEFVAVPRIVAVSSNPFSKGGIVYDPVTARKKFTELVAENPDKWQVGFQLAIERGLKPDFDHIYFWEKGRKEGVRTSNIALQEEFGEGNGRVAILYFSGGSDRFYVSGYWQAYSTTEELWGNAEFVPTGDHDGYITTSIGYDWEDLHGHDSAMQCQRPGCLPQHHDEDVSFPPNSRKIPRVVKVGMQSACDLHPQCARMKAIANCWGVKWGQVWRSFSVWGGGSLLGCLPMSQGFLSNYALCVGGGALTGFGAGVIDQYFFTDSCP